MNATKENEIRRVTGDALRQAQDGFEEFRKLFEACSDIFEDGEDAAGFKKLQEVLPILNNFIGFTHDVIFNCKDLMKEEHIQEMNRVNSSLEETLQEMVAEAEQGNIPAVSELLRGKLCNMMKRYSDLFPKIAEALEEPLPV